MSSFTKPLLVEVVDVNKWRIYAPFEYHVGAYPSAETIRVPAGYITDFATVPRALWSVFPPHGKYAKAAVIHDYIYTDLTERYTKKQADKIFLEAMKVLGVSMIRRRIMYRAVRIFGRGSWT